MFKHHYCALLCTILCLQLHAQTYTDFLGNGHQIGINISSSNESGNSLDDHVISGNGRFTDEVGASRFLAQASMGANYEDIQEVAGMGIDDWLDFQFSMTPNSFESEYTRIYNDAIALTPNNITHKNEYMSYTFYETLMKHPDVLRQKVAFALSQIFVISPTNSILTNRGYANAHYYDMLYLGAFGNFHDLLYNVTLHPCMGIYLSHLQNQKPDIIQGTSPDENYAREIMQLFSIGLFELNTDGTPKLDANGDIIPTYDIEDIQELSKVFTGLSGSARLNGAATLFATGIGALDLREPMTMYYDYHSKREKVLIDGTVIPENQLGLDDVDDAIDVLFNHDNVGPFIGKRLIQQLVKSNPSPQYVHRVSTVFNNDGNGVRGNMEAVIRQILIDPEARDCTWFSDPTSGKLIQPLQRLTNLFLAFDVSTPSNKFYFRDELELFDKLEQSFLAAPTVFNFFTPFYAEKDFVEPNELVSPEFQILNSTTGMYYLNETEDKLKVRPFLNRTLPNAAQTALNNNNADRPVFDFTDEIAIYQNQGLRALIDRLNLLICRGQLHPNIENMIVGTIQNNIANVATYDVNDIINDAIYYIMITPNYTILK
jgi:uncharacterized protein (DUF1800 family)